jgi:AraC-like DNA-binding protein
LNQKLYETGAYVTQAVAHARFSDIDSLGRLAGWDLDFRQLDPGAVEIRSRWLAGPNTNILGFRISRGFHQRGYPPRETLTFGIPLVGLRDWRGRSIEAPALVDFNHVWGLDCVSTQRFAGVTLAVNVNFLNTVCEAFQLPLYEDLHQAKSGSVVPQSDAALSLRDRLLRHLDGVPGRFDEEQESQVVVDLLAALTATSCREDSTSAHVRSRVVTAAVEYVEDHRNEAITVGDICRDTGVSWRTLDRAFRERFGIGPKAYATRRRLQGARQDLLTGPAGVRISDIANAWGFWHMGQFARDYRRLFGELPSQTARSARTV